MLRLPARGWRRTLALRRLAAAALVVVAAFLTLRPEVAAPGGRVVVAARDLRPGVPLAAPDVAVRVVPTELVPAGALTDPGPAVGRLTVGAVRAGEPLTDVRLLGRDAASAALAAPDAAGVPLRLADPGVAALLGPGQRVDVVGAGPAAGAGAGAAGDTRPAGARPEDGRSAAPAQHPVVLAAGAVVLGVLPPPERTGTGPVVVVALPGPVAARVAAVTLSEEVTVTLR